MPSRGEIPWLSIIWVTWEDRVLCRIISAHQSINEAVKGLKTSPTNALECLVQLGDFPHLFVFGVPLLDCARS